MKLSEMNTKQLASALCQLTVPMSAIATDSELNGVFENISERTAKSKHMTMFEKMGMLLEAVPVLLEKHYAETVKIISVMTGKTFAEVEAQNGMEMIVELRECIDKQFLDFFRSSAAMGKTVRGKAE